MTEPLTDEEADTLRETHRLSRGSVLEEQFCAACQDTWPCNTVRAVARIQRDREQCADAERENAALTDECDALQQQLNDVQWLWAIRYGQKMNA